MHGLKLELILKTKEVKLRLQAPYNWKPIINSNEKR